MQLDKVFSGCKECIRIVVPDEALIRQYFPTNFATNVSHEKPNRKFKCPGSTHEGGTPNAPRTPADPRRRGGLHVPFSNCDQWRKASLQRQRAGAQHSRGHDVLPAKLAADRVHGPRWSRRQGSRRPGNQAGCALINEDPDVASLIAKGVARASV